jgi:hypothetical protein
MSHFSPISELSVVLEKREEKLRKKERALEDEQSRRERTEAELETARKEISSLQERSVARWKRPLNVLLNFSLPVWVGRGDRSSWWALENSDFPSVIARV